MDQSEQPTRRTAARPTLELGETIRAAREGRRLSMQAAAAQAGISSGYQFKLEGGVVRTPSPRVLDRLGRVLDLPYPELMLLAGYPAGMAAPSNESTAAGPLRAGDPTNRMIIELLERLRRDVSALREEVRSIAAVQGRSAPGQDRELSQPAAGRARRAPR